MSAMCALVGQPASKSMPATNTIAENILPDLRIMCLPETLLKRISVPCCGNSLGRLAKFHVENKYRVHRLRLAVDKVWLELLFFDCFDHCRNHLGIIDGVRLR